MHKHTTTLAEVHEYYKTRIFEVQKFASDFGSGDLWAFLMCSSFIDFLVKMVVNNEKASNSIEYKLFIEKYLSLVNPAYRDFAFQSGKKDLPKQIYHVLRCGIVHSYSLCPDQKSQKSGGRKRSIVLGHRKNGYTHLAPFTENGNDSIIFTIEDFSRDLGLVLDKIFNDIVPFDSIIANNIISWVSKYPPIQLTHR